MKRRRPFCTSYYALAFCFLMVFGCATIRQSQELKPEKIIPSEDPRAYANSIVEYENVHAEYSIQNILGISLFPEAYSSGCSLGNGWVIVDMGEGEEVIDQDGPDLRVYERDSNYHPKWLPDSYYVFVSDDRRRWEYLGMGVGTDSFDLSIAKMRQARYVKLKGLGAPQFKSLKSPGPDIDAIEALHMRGPSVPVSTKISGGFRIPIIRPPMVKEYEHITLGRKQHTMMNTGLSVNEGEIYSIVVDDISLRSYLMVKVGNSTLDFNPPYHAKAPTSGDIYMGVYKDPVSGTAPRPIDAHIIIWEKEDYSAVADFFEERKRKIPKNKAIVEALDEANKQWGKYLASQKAPERRVTYEDEKIAKGEERVPKPSESPEQLDEVKKRLEEERMKAILLGRELEEKEKREKALLSKLDEGPKIAPIIVIVTPKDGSTSEGEMVRFSGVVEDEKGLERVDIFLNNEQVVTRGLRVTEKKYPKRLEFQKGILLQVGENEIMLRAVDSDGLSSEKAVKVHYLKSKIDVKSTALLIGVSEYEHWDGLVNPTTDIEAIAIELEQYYGFDIRKLRNVSKTEILTEIRELAKGNYTKDEQLLIWFSGHGYFDDLSKIGYIVAKDTLSLSADPIFDTFLDYPKLMRIISNIPCRHILLVVDACFAGTLDSRLAMRSTDLYADIPKEEYIQRKLKFKTRLYLTSGGKQYVSDGRPGQHSPFTRKFLAALRSYGGRDGILTFEEIISLYMDKVRPQPRYNEFLGNEPGSSFIFIAQ